MKRRIELLFRKLDPISKINSFGLCEPSTYENYVPFDEEKLRLSSKTTKKSKITTLATSICLKVPEGSKSLVNYAVIEKQKKT